jgi:hypothetical protein
VRNLEKQLGRIVRKVVVQFLKLKFPVGEGEAVCQINEIVKNRSKYSANPSLEVTGKARA